VTSTMGGHPIRVLIVGFGSIGQRHARNVRVLVPNSEIVVLRRSLGDRDDGYKVVTTLPSALATDPDMAIVATPSAAHIEVLPELLRAGVPSYVEKPVVTETSQVAEVRNAMAVRPDVRHMSGFNLRLLPSLQLAQRLVQDGVLGHVARATFSAGQWLPDWRNVEDFRQSYSASRSGGGGVIFDLSHELDAARLLLGDMHLTGCTTTRPPGLGIEAEGAASMIGLTEMGAVVSANVDYVARRAIRRYEVVGDKASLVWDLAQRRMELHGPAGVEIITDRLEDFDVGETYVEGLRRFIASVSGHDTPFQSLEDGLRSTELAIRAHMLDTNS